jgi:hypothetical protein
MFKPGLVVCTSNPSSWEAEAEESLVQGQPELQSEILYIKKLIFKLITLKYQKVFTFIVACYSLPSL